MFRDNPSLLGESLSIATSSLSYLERRFGRNPNVFQSYSEFFSEYDSLGLMHQISCEAFNYVYYYYIPHHAVFKATGNTTKIRVIFNASMKSSSGKSLNDLLYADPKLQPTIVSILCNFRMYPVVFTCDISKMYRQILVLPEHRKHQHILWRSPSNDSITDFELQTVTY